MDERNNLPQELTPELTPEAVPEAACGCCAGCGGSCPHSEAAAAAEAELEAAAEEEAALEAAVDDALAAELLPERAEEEEPPEIPAQPERVSVVDIHFRSGGKVYYFDPDGLELKAGDHVIIDTARGAEYGICASGCHLVPVSDVVSPLRKVLRVATAQDEKIAADNREKEKKAYSVCLQKIRDHKLDMQLVSAECAFDGSKILFFFTADGRVDFRELVKNLASVFRTRIELRQIGVRDKAKMVGGLGVCGRPSAARNSSTTSSPFPSRWPKPRTSASTPPRSPGPAAASCAASSTSRRPTRIF